MIVVLAALAGFVVGVMVARNLNAQDRQFWKERGRKAALATQEAG